MVAATVDLDEVSSYRGAITSLREQASDAPRCGASLPDACRRLLCPCANSASCVLQRDPPFHTLPHVTCKGVSEPGRQAAFVGPVTYRRVSAHAASPV